MTKLYANISIDHQGRYSTLESRIITAAQCNADAVVINKTNPILVIPEEKRYVPVDSRWGTIPYIDYARKSEITPEDCGHITALCERIGIPLIWCVTDSASAEFVKLYSNSNIIKVHANATNTDELVNFCYQNFEHVIYNSAQEEIIQLKYNVKQRYRYSIYYTTTQDNLSLEDLKFSTLDNLIERHQRVGYESRYTGIFPCIATAYKGLDFIEKYLGDESADANNILTPIQFFEFYKNLELLGIANGT